MLESVVAILFLVLGFFEASTRQITFATWNLGWHMDVGTVQRWIDACSKTYLEDTATHRWNLSSDPLAKPGWEVPNTFSING